MRVFDVTLPISERMTVWPGDPSVKIPRVCRISCGDSLNLSQLCLSSHAGTHVDAPYHFVEGGMTVDKLPLDLLMGPAFVVEVNEPEENAIQLHDLDSVHIPIDTERLLLKTTNSSLWEDHVTVPDRDYVYLDSKAAKWLVGRGIRLLGVDHLSVDRLGSQDFETHHVLLEAGTVIVEGLNLARVPAGPCQLVCLPLKVEGGDGAPARVLVIRD